MKKKIEIKTKNMYKNFQKKNPKMIKTIFGLFLLGNSIFLFLSFYSFIFHWKNDQSQLYSIFDKEIIAENLLGKMGAAVSHYFIHGGIGLSAFFLPISLFLMGLRIFFVKKKILKNSYQYIIYQLLFFSIWIPITFYLIFPKKGILSGIVGFEIGNFLISLFGKVGLGILLIISIFLYFILLFSSIKTKKIKNGIKKKIPSCNEEINAILKLCYNMVKKYFFKKKTHYIDEKITFLKKKPIINPIINPTYSLKSNNNNEDFSYMEEKYLEKNKKKIIKILNFYKIKVYNIKATIGPTITLYEIFPNVGVRVSKIKNLENEIALNLSALSIRIIAPIPGKGSIGIEIPNHHHTIVYMKNILESEKIFKKSHQMELPISLGKTVFNEIFMIDLAKMPHLLIAGSTGQGKSVGLNSMIVFLLYNKNSEEIKFILIDPKKVEFSIYNKISKSYFALLPNYIDPIITHLHEVIDVLNSLCKEMDNRYVILKKAMVRNIQEYNIKYEKKYHLPYIILIIDEFADLSLSFKKKEIEIYITRLSQLSRAVGIHLIIATQRPSVNVITGLIKSNFTARVSFKVSSKIDSITILDSTGAEKLIGRGDSLFYNKNELIRLQCPFIDINDIQKIINFYGQNNFTKKKYFFLPEPDAK
ncbi:DNA translocase FtsK 4TM domain-containing protein [Blattabacterium cuenoti]|uniref:DNA translocase FtsK 4TM domain-containing protein n=1 Tax=Blattabacterium cuenoti TaxID=1653831 RepID=UPI001EEAD402|nr:DNA translocase FtsK 4TM domain-containing protein [Blattabacterium cuenoti]